MKIIFPKPTKKRQEEARGRVRVGYLLLTNEPSNHKEWARGERRKGMWRAERRNEKREKREKGNGKVNLAIRKKINACRKKGQGHGRTV